MVLFPSSLATPIKLHWFLSISEPGLQSSRWFQYFYNKLLLPRSRVSFCCLQPEHPGQLICSSIFPQGPQRQLRNPEPGDSHDEAFFTCIGMASPQWAPLLRIPSNLPNLASPSPSHQHPWSLLADGPSVWPASLPQAASIGRMTTPMPWDHLPHSTIHLDPRGKQLCPLLASTPHTPFRVLSTLDLLLQPHPQTSLNLLTGVMCRRTVGKTATSLPCPAACQGGRCAATWLYL